MADTTHNIRSVWYAQDRNVLAFLGQLNSGLSNTARTSGTMSRGFMQSNNYLKALSVTMRYAFAGEVIQRIRMAYQNLREFQNGLADVVAIGTEADNVTGLQTQSLQYLGQQALRTSNMTTTAAQDILSTYRAIYSSMQNVSPQQVASLGSLATKGAAISETDPRTFIQAIIGMRNAFGKEAGNMQDIADQFFTVIQRSINMSGDEWAHYSGRLVAAARVAGVSLQQMNALMVLMTRSGGTAAVNIRHLSQLLQRIKFPTKSAQPFYAQAGIPLVGGAVVNPGITGVDVIRTLLNRAARISGVSGANFSQGAVNRMSRPEFNQQLRAATTGPGLAFLHGAVGGRMEGFRAFLVIAQQLRNYSTETNAAAKASGATADAFDRLIREKPLEAMSNSMNVFTTGLLRSGNPLFRVMAKWERSITDSSLRFEQWLGKGAGGAERGVNRRVSGLLSHIPGLGSRKSLISSHAGTEAALFTLLAGGYAGARLSGMGGRLGGVLGRVAGVGKGGTNALLTAEALPAALTGNGSGSRAAPFWVIIHPLSYSFAPKNSLFGSGNEGGGLVKTLKNLYNKTGPGGSAAGGAAGAAAVNAARASRAIQISRIARLARIGGSAGAFAPALPDAISILAGHDPFKDVIGSGASTQQMMGKTGGFGPMISKYFTLDKSNNLVPRKGTPRWVVDALNSTRSNGKILGFLPGGQTDPNPAKAERIIRALYGSRFANESMGLNHAQRTGNAALLKNILRDPGVSVVNQSKIAGEVVATIQLDPGPQLKGIVKPKTFKIHIPTKLWNQAQPPPTSRGKTKESRHN